MVFVNYYWGFWFVRLCTTHKSGVLVIKYIMRDAVLVFYFITSSILFTGISG